MLDVIICTFGDSVLLNKPLVGNHSFEQFSDHSRELSFFPIPLPCMVSELKSVHVSPSYLHISSQCACITNH